MNIYLISPTSEFTFGYDTYDSAVVCADSEEEARKIHPDNNGMGLDYVVGYSWPRNPDQVNATLIGVALDNIEKGEVILASFNAG